MRVILLRLMVAVALAIGGWWSWQEARVAARSGDAKEQIALLRFADVPPDADPHSTATTAYWLGRYDAVIPDSGDEETDAELLLMAANAAFRSTERNPGTGPAAVQRLDGVLNTYASALKAASGAAASKAAAYNYEYVARLRDQVARSQGKAIKRPPAPAAAPAGDLPAGSTIHGHPGAPPPDAKMEDLEILAPMEYGDREAQPEATPGGKRERKG
jgi:hypothetical protein